MAKPSRFDIQAMAARQDAVQIRIAASAAARYRTVIRADYKRLADAVRQGRPISDTLVNDDDMGRALELNWAAAAKSAGNSTAIYLGQRKKHIGCEIHTKAGLFTDIVRVGMAEYATRWLGRKIVQIGGTTAKQVADIAEQYDGDSLDDIAARIERVSSSFSAVRALVIARTETHAAANFASQAVAEATGDPLQKQWVATADSRTRDDHLDTDGKIVGLNDSFDVGGEQLEYPGDPSGSAENVINCRCQAVYIDPDYR